MSFKVRLVGKMWTGGRLIDVYKQIWQIVHFLFFFIVNVVMGHDPDHDNETLAFIWWL